MSFLAILLPERPRLGAAAPAAEGAEAPAVRPGQEYAWASSTDALALKTQGAGPAALMPKAAQVVLVVPDADVAWHRVTCPKAPSGRLRDALVGVLEDELLDDPATVHLALAPGAVPGKPAWVAVIHRAWLHAHLESLERAGVLVDRIVPASWPDHPPCGHFEHVAGLEALGAGIAGGEPSRAGLVLNWSHADGVARLPLTSPLARGLLPAEAWPMARWTATPEAVAAAQQWTDAPVALMTPAQRALQAARSTLDLRQFDLAPRQRGSRWLRAIGKQWQAPAWRPVRLGLAGLVAVHLLGLNLWAWQQRRAVEQRQQTQVATLQASFPQVRAVLDAPLQMQREVERLRALAGRAGDGDLEPMLQAASAAWPADRPPVDSLRYESGRLTLSAAGWSAPQIEQFRGQLEPAGWRVEATEGRLVLSRTVSGAVRVGSGA